MLKLSVVTPSLNQAPFLRDALESVHSQGYSNLEHWVIDGGSTDGSVEILEEYATKGMLQFISERDSGQSSAINKGLRRLTGEVVCWLNSDDAYSPGALPFVADYFAAHPESQVLTGDCRMVDPHGHPTAVGRGGAVTREQLIRIEKPVYQPSTFFRRSLLQRVGFLDENLHYAMDYEFWLRVTQVARFHYVPRVLATYRFHAESKSTRPIHTTFLPEFCRVSRRHWGCPLSPLFWKRCSAVGSYAARLYYGAAMAARAEGAPWEYRRYLRLALRNRPWHTLYWRELCVAYWGLK